MNIGLVINGKGKICLVHDEPFQRIPAFVKYHIDRLQLEISFEGGDTYPIDWVSTPEMDRHMLVASKILLIRMEHKAPVEGYDTSLLKWSAGRCLPRPQVLDDGTHLEIAPDGDLLVLLPDDGTHRVPVAACYNGLLRRLGIDWVEGTTTWLVAIPIATQLSTADLGQDAVREQLKEVRERLEGEQAALPITAFELRRDYYRRIEQSCRDFECDGRDELHRELVTRSYIRVGYRPNSEPDRVAVEVVTVPLSLTLDGAEELAQK